MSLNLGYNSTSKASKVKDVTDLKEEIHQELIRLLDYWSSEVIDTRHGGFLGRIDHFGEIDLSAPKGIVLNARILWTFSSAYRITGIEKYKEAANRAYNYLMTHFWDQQNGGFVWEVDFQGRKSNVRKQTYAQGFGIYALAEYNRACANVEALEYARQLFYILETRVHDNKFGGYVEALSNDWSKLDDMRLSPKDDNTPKSMNTHLHILEPYTNLFRVWPDKKLKESIENLLVIFHNKIIDPKTGHFNLFFDTNWSVKSSIVSYGHDIEGAWLMHEAALTIRDFEIIKEVRKTAIKLVDVTLNEGTDVDGSLYNEKHGNILDKEKHWWPQAEALVGLLDAYSINGQIRYLEEFVKIWTFIKEKLIDTKNGEWYWRVDMNGTPITTDDKVGFWKCPYHNCRALMEILERIEHL